MEKIKIDWEDIEEELFIELFKDENNVKDLRIWKDSIYQESEYILNKCDKWFYFNTRYAEA